MSGIPDGQKCLICHEKAYSGRIVHQPVPRCIYPASAALRRAAGGAAGGLTGVAVADGRGPARYALLVSKLEPTRRRNRYVCPVDGAGRADPGKGLKIDPAAELPLIVCFTARRYGVEWKVHVKEILDVVGLNWGDIMPDRVEQWLDDVCRPDQPILKRSRR